MKKIVLISAKAQHGKDTFAEILRSILEEQGYSIAVDRFAKYIKNFLKDYYNWDGFTKDEAIRQKLQILGTEVIKEKLNYKCFHAKRLAEDFNIVQDDFDFFLVPDTRFEDEIFIFKAMFPDKVITVRIQRDDFTGILTTEQQQHRSETALDNFTFDYIISNNGTLDELRSKAEEFIKHIL